MNFTESNTGGEYMLERIESSHVGNTQSDVSLMNEWTAEKKSIII